MVFPKGFEADSYCTRGAGKLPDLNWPPISRPWSEKRWLKFYFLTSKLSSCV